MERFDAKAKAIETEAQQKADDPEADPASAQPQR
jgi:hypothetical protein